MAPVLPAFFGGEIRPPVSRFDAESVWKTWVRSLAIVLIVAVLSPLGVLLPSGGDVKVDFFTSRLSGAAVHALDACGSFLYALVGTALASRAFAGALAVRASGESSVILGWPVWVAQFLMVPGFALMALAGLYMVGVHLRLSASHAAGKRA